MKSISGKIRQRVTTLMLVYDWNIHRPKDRAQKARSTVTASRPVLDTVPWAGLTHGALNGAQHGRLTAILPDVLTVLRCMLTTVMAHVVMTPLEHAHDRSKSVRTNQIVVPKKSVHRMGRRRHNMPAFFILDLVSVTCLAPNEEFPAIEE